MAEIAFINASHPDEFRSRHIQGVIRSHVMKDNGKARRKRPRRPEVFTLQVHTSSLATNPHAEHESARTTEEELTQELKSESTGPSWSLSPSGITGIDLNPRTLQIMHYLKGEMEYQYRPFRFVWFRMGLSDSTAFYLSIASALLFWDRRRDILSTEYWDNPEAAKYYSIALGQLRGRLGDPQQHVSAGVIATVLGCLCHDVTAENWTRWSYHVDGLHRIADLRGGLDGLENEIPLMAFWMDLVGRTVLDETPHFPIPRELRVSLTTAVRLSPRLHKLESTYPQLTPIAQALGIMSSIADTVNCRGKSMSFWQDEVAALQMVGPITHYLLTEARVSCGREGMLHSSAAAELARLACLILLSGLKQQFLLNASDMVPLQNKLAVASCREIDGLDVQLSHLRLWALITSALLLPSNLRTNMISHIRAVIRTVGLNEPREAIELAKEFVWIDAIESSPAESLVEQITCDPESDNLV